MYVVSSILCIENNALMSDEKTAKAVFSVILPIFDSYITKIDSK